MKLSRIYASKIYLTNSRQDRIHAAINDPLNVELVQQVAEYLDEDSQEELKDAIAEKKARKAAANPDNRSSEEPNENVFDDVDSALFRYPSHVLRWFYPFYAGIVDVAFKETAAAADR